MPEAPELTNADRRAGHQASLVVRRQRASLKAALKKGQLTLGEAVERAEAQQMKVIDLLRALPRVAWPRAVGILADCGIADTRTVAQLGPKQLQKLLSVAEKKP